jgi:hypothetical protein
LRWRTFGDSCGAVSKAAGAHWHCALATSADGIHWHKPAFDVVNGTNIVLPGGQRVASGKNVDTYTMWLDHDEPNPNQRYKYFATEFGHPNQKNYLMAYRASAGGIHWSKTAIAKNDITRRRLPSYFSRQPRP